MSIHDSTGRPIDRVLERLDNVRQHNGYFMACCPAHEDHEPSLSIDEGDDGRVLLRCFAGCPTERIVASMDLTMRDLFPDNQPPHRLALASAPRRIVATYDYHDADGQLVFQVVRYEPKGFRQRRPDGNSGW